MSRERLVSHATDLAWSLWTELGVPGVVRRHTGVAIDPEPLIVASPRLAAHDPRLLGLVYSWCADNDQRISASRLRGLAALAPSSAQEALAPMVATLRQDQGVRWSVPSPGEPWAAPPEKRLTQVNVSRPPLLRLRLRALAGVGARADVLAELLGRADHWVRASDLQDEGYSKRNVARILSELTEAGLVEMRVQGKTHLIRLPRTTAIGELVGATDLAFPRWRPILAVVLTVIDLADLSDRPAATRRVEAHKAAERLRPAAREIELASPPSTRGNPDAWDEVLTWAADQTSALATGDSLALA